LSAASRIVELRSQLQAAEEWEKQTEEQAKQVEDQAKQERQIQQETENKISATSLKLHLRSCHHFFSQRLEVQHDKMLSMQVSVTHCLAFDKP